MQELLLSTDFSGLGSPEEALKRLGVPHRVVFACERDKYARLSYEANHSPEIFYNDVTTRDNDTVPYSDCYVFGFPCQAFSIAGKQLGFEDMRGTLVFNSADYIRKKRPRTFIGENVKGLLSHDGGRTFRTIIDTFAISENGSHNMFHKIDCLGYHVFYKVHNTKNYGIPQNRERIFIIGFRDEADALNFRHPEKLKGFKSTIDILLNTKKDYKVVKTDIQIMANGIRLNTIKKLAQLPGGFESANRVYCPHGILPTLTLKWDRVKIFVNGKVRHMHPIEYFRAQGYSDRFFYNCARVNKSTQLYKQAGNSITVDTIMHIMKRVLIAIGYKFDA